MQPDIGAGLSARTKNLLLTAIFLASVLVHLAYVFTVHLESRAYKFREKEGVEISDLKVVGNEEATVNIARNLYARGFFSMDGKKPTASYMPLLPVLIAFMFLFTDNLVYMMVFNCFLIALIALATYKLSTLFFSTRASLITMAAVAFAPFTFDAYLNLFYDPYNTLFVLGALYFLVLLRRAPKYRYAVYSGVLCGLAVLARAESVLLIPIYFGYFLYLQVFKKRRILPFALIFLAVSCLTFSPWVIRNYLSMHFLGLSTMSGDVFSGAHNERVLVRHPGSWQGYWLYFSPQEKELVANMDEVEANKYKWQRGFKVLGQFSLSYLLYVELRKLMNTLKPSFRVLPKEYSNALNLFLLSPFFILYLLFFLYLGKFIQNYGILLLPFLVTLAVTLVFWGSKRWRIPFEPIIFALVIGYLLDYKFWRRPAPAP